MMNVNNLVNLKNAAVSCGKKNPSLYGFNIFFDAFFDDKKIEKGKMAEVVVCYMAGVLASAINIKWSSDILDDQYCKIDFTVNSVPIQMKYKWEPGTSDDEETCQERGIKFVYVLPTVFEGGHKFRTTGTEIMSQMLVPEIFSEDDWNDLIDNDIFIVIDKIWESWLNKQDTDRNWQPGQEDT